MDKLKVKQEIVTKSIPVIKSKYDLGSDFKLNKTHANKKAVNSKLAEVSNSQNSVSSSQTNSSFMENLKKNNPFSKIRR